MFLAPSQNLFSEFRVQSSSLSILPITFQEYFLSCHLHFVLQRNEEILPVLQGAVCEHTLSLTSHVSPCQEAQTQNQSQTCSPGRSPRFSLRLGAGYFVFPMINKDHESYLRVVYSVPRAHACCTCTHMAHVGYVRDIKSTTHQQWLPCLQSSLTFGTG